MLASPSSNACFCAFVKPLPLTPFLMCESQSKEGEWFLGMVIKDQSSSPISGDLRLGGIYHFTRVNERGKLQYQGPQCHKNRIHWN